jgi:hypothetical protein
VPLVVTAELGVELSKIPSPVKVTLVTVPEPPEGVAHTHELPFHVGTLFVVEQFANVDSEPKAVPFNFVPLGRFTVEHSERVTAPVEVLLQKMFPSPDRDETPLLPPVENGPTVAPAI